MCGVRLRGYYAILDVHPNAGPDAGGDVPAVVARARRLLAARPCVLQVRAKGAPAATLSALARAVSEVTRAAGIPLCVNDRLDVALAVGAEAVHLGQDDLPLAEARRLAAGRLMIGVSTHDAAQATAAMVGGADYVGFGPVFATTSKRRPDPIVGPEALGRVARVATVPVVAIGGITPANVGEVAAAGAVAAALIAAVEKAADPAAVGRLVNAAFGA